MKFTTALKVLVAMHVLPAFLLGSFFTSMFAFCGGGGGNSFVQGIEQSPGKTNYVRNLAKSSHNEKLPFQFPLRDYNVALPVLLKNKASGSAASRRQAIFDRVLAASNRVLAEKAEEQKRMLPETVNRKIKVTKNEKKQSDTTTYSPTPSLFSTCPLNLQQAGATIEEQEKVIEGLIKELEKYEEEDLEVVTQKSEMCRFRRQRPLYGNNNAYDYFLEAIAMDPLTQGKDKIVRTRDFIFNYSHLYGKKGSIIMVSKGEQKFEGRLKNIINTKFSHAAFFDFNSTNSIYGNEDPERHLARVKYELIPSPSFFEINFFDEETGFSEELQDCSFFIDESEQYSDEYKFAIIDMDSNSQITREEMRTAFDKIGAWSMLDILGLLDSPDIALDELSSIVNTPRSGSKTTTLADTSFTTIDKDNSGTISNVELSGGVYSDTKFPVGVNTELGVGFDPSVSGGGATRSPWEDIPKCNDVDEGTTLECIDFEYSRSTDPAVYEASFIHDSKSLQESMSVSAKAQAGYMGATVSVSAKYATNQEFTQDSVTNLLTASQPAYIVKIKNQGQMKLRNSTRSMLSAERFPEGAEQFLNDFGIFCTTALTTGGTFNGSFKLSANTQQAEAELRVTAEVEGSSGVFSVSGSTAYEEKQKSRSKSITSTARMETTGGIPPDSNDPEDPLAVVTAHTEWADSIKNEKNLVSLYQTVGVWSAWTVIYDLMDSWPVDTDRKRRVRDTFLGIQLIAKDETEAASLEQTETKLLIKTLERMKEWSTIKNNESSMNTLKKLKIAATKYNRRMERDFNVMAILELKDELEKFEEGNDQTETADTSWLWYRKKLVKDYNKLVEDNLLPIGDYCSADTSCSSTLCCFGNCFSGTLDSCYQKHPKGVGAIKGCWGWSEAHLEKFLSGYACGDETKYNNRDDAESACIKCGSCKGITTDDQGMWTIREGDQLIDSETSETSYMKVSISCSVVDWPSPQKTIQIQTKNLNELYYAGSPERSWDVYDGENERENKEGDDKDLRPPYTYEQNGSDSQGFIIKDGQIVSIKSTKVIGVKGSASSNFVNLFMTYKLDKPILKQQWMYLSNGDIINRESGFCVSFVLDGGDLMKYPLFVQKCSDKHTYYSRYQLSSIFTGLAIGSIDITIYQNPLWTLSDF